MCLHLVGLITIYVLPRFIQGERRQQKSISRGKISSNDDAQQNGNENEIGNEIELTTSPNNPVSNGLNSSDKTITIELLLNGNSTNSHNNNEQQQFIHKIPMNQCDISKLLKTSAQSDEHDFIDVTQTSQNTKTDSLKKSIKLSDEKTTDNHLSMKIRERIDSETSNIKEFIDKTVTGIVEVKNDIMRVNNDELYLNSNGIINGKENGVIRKRNLTDLTTGKEIETFLRKEINSAVNQMNVLPAVLSNGHAD